MGIEQTVQSLISASFDQRSRKQLQQKSKRMRTRWCQRREMVLRQRMFRWVLQCWFCQFDNVPNFMIGQVLSYFSGHQLLFTEVHVYINVLAVSVGFYRPLNYDTDYRIFNVPTWSFNACAHSQVLLFFLSLFRKTEWLPFSWGWGELRTPFFSFRGWGVGVGALGSPFMKP